MTVKKSQHPMVFVLLGRAGAGKTETGSFFAKKSGLGIPLIPLADIMRAWAKQGHPVAMQCVASIKKGKYFSGDWSIQILSEYLQQHPDTFRNGFIIDGFPRKMQDVPLFENFCSKNGFFVGGVIHLSVSHDTSILRQLQRKREPLEVIHARMKEFSDKEAQVIAHYHQKGMVKTINTESNRQVQTARNELALKNRAFLWHVAARIKKIVKTKIPRKPK